MKASDADFGQTFDTAFKNLWEHGAFASPVLNSSAHCCTVVPEERDDLPQLEEKLSMEESVKLAKQFRKTKQWAPTRSHPSAPAHTPFETAAALLAAPLDRLSDMLCVHTSLQDSN